MNAPLSWSVSDTISRDNTMAFLEHRTTPVMVASTYQTFHDEEAPRVRGESIFLERLVDHGKDGNDFLLGCDRCNTVTQFSMTP